MQRRIFAWACLFRGELVVKRFYAAALGALLWAPPPAMAEAEAPGTPPPAGARSVAEQRGDDFFAGDVTGVSGEPVPLGVVTNDAYPSSDLFTFSGLPPGVRLSAGGEWNGVWIAPRKDVRGLSFLSAKGLDARFSVVITRAQMPSRPPQSLTVQVTLSNSASATAEAPAAEPAQAPEAAEPAAAPAEPAQAPPPSHVSSPGEKILLDKAADLLRKADISGARAILEYLVAKGEPKAALLLGETYDPNVLSTLYTKGVEANKSKAIELYQKALKSGSPEAKARLDALPTQ